MKVLFDTNVVLDVLLDRAPFSAKAAGLFGRVERGELSGFLCASTVTTIHYLVGTAAGRDQAAQMIARLLVLFEIAPVNRLVLETALAAGFTDFEDAVLHEAAGHAGVQAIVTRDPKGYLLATLPVFSPDELTRALDAGAK